MIQKNRKIKQNDHRKVKSNHGLLSAPGTLTIRELPNVTTLLRSSKFDFMKVHKVAL